MTLEAVWYKNGMEVHRVAPVMNIVCYENMKDIEDIEIENKEYEWHSYKGADDFVIRLVKDK